MGPKKRLGCQGGVWQVSIFLRLPLKQIKYWHVMTDNKTDIIELICPGRLIWLTWCWGQVIVKKMLKLSIPRVKGRADRSLLVMSSLSRSWRQWISSGMLVILFSLRSSILTFRMVSRCSGARLVIRLEPRCSSFSRGWIFGKDSITRNFLCPRTGNVSHLLK